VKPARRHVRLIVFGAIFLILALAAGGYYFVNKDLQNMRDNSRENLLWSVLQLEIELLRFEKSLAGFTNPQNPVTPAQVNQRFDILWSRVSVFEQSAVGKRIHAYETESDVVSGLLAELKRQEADIVALQPGSARTVSRLIRAFSPYAPDLRRLSLAVYHGEERFAASLRQALWQSSSVLTYVSLLILLVLLALVIFLRGEIARHKSVARQNRELLQDAETASQGKSQFLTMMSHGLRTPMNGILGLIALAREQGGSAEQQRLLARAELSGQHLNTLFVDIIDLSSLQTGDLKTDQKPFDVAHLCEAIRKVFAPLMRREGISLKVDIDAQCPACVRGDFRRLRQSVIHLVAFLVETAGARNLSLDLDHRDGNLQVRLSYDYSRAGGEWEPSLILGRIDRGGDTISSDALGPAVARGLIEQMNGCIRLDTGEKHRAAVFIQVPAKIMRIDQLVIRMLTRSAALSAIIEAALKPQNVRFEGAQYQGEIHAVLLEAGSDDEDDLVRNARLNHPHALLVCLGKPNNAVAFDDRIDLPVDVASLRRSRFVQLAS
jgi:signal transduction histidine kinase